MNELLWIAVGFALAAIALRPWRRRAAADLDASGEIAAGHLAAGHLASGDLDAVGTVDAAADVVASEAATPPTTPTSCATDPASPRLIQLATVPPDSQRMAQSLADELANLVSGVESRAHHLIEAAPTRTQLPAAAEAMLASVARLRRLHGKLVAFSHGREPTPGITDVRELIAGLSDELLQMQFGLELHWEPPPNLPLLAAHPEAVHDALLFLGSALLRAERGATRLSFVVERSFATEPPTVQIELMLEWITNPNQHHGEVLADSLFTLDLEAANHLLTNYGGELTLTHLPGRSARAMARLPMAIPAAIAADASAAQSTLAEPEQHQYGGALVLESDPSLRAVLARELKASGRAVFTCADGASAHTFLQATPDRFELLIVDDPRQLEHGASLAEAIRTHAPGLKICLLTPGPATPRADWPRLFWLQKPFGVHELRRKLAAILTAG